MRATVLTGLVASLGLLVGAAMPTGAVARDPAAGRTTPVDAVAAVSAPADGATQSALETLRDAPRGVVDTAPDDRVTILVAPASGGALNPGVSLGVRLEVVNKTNTAVPAGTATLSLSTATIDTRSAYARWMAGDEPNRGHELQQLAMPSVAPGASASVVVDVPTSAIPLDAEADFGPRGLAAHYSAGEFSGEARSSIVFTSPFAGNATPLAVVVPITPPASTAGVLTADELSGLTQPEGRLTALLNAVDGTNATLAIDPRLIASIRALGEAAPASARAWLQRLEDLPNPSFALPYADADLSLQQQAGITEPLSLDVAAFDLDPAHFPSATTAPPTADASPADPSPSDGAGTGSATPDTTPPGATASPTSPPAATTPTLAELTAFDYTLDSVAWPAEGTVNDADLAAFARWGFRNLILDGGNAIFDDDPAFTPAASANLGGWSTAITDSGMSDALTHAANGATESERLAGSASAATILAVVSRELPFEPRGLVGAVAHGAVEHPESLGQTLRALDTMSWHARGTLLFPDLASGTEVARATLVPGRVEAPVVARVQELVQTEQRGGIIASIFNDPALSRGTLRASLLATLSSGWRHDLAAWIPASKSYLDHVTATEASVSIGQSSDIQLVGHESQLPVFVANTLDERVTVHVLLEPATGRIEAGGAVPLVIEPHSMARAVLPITAISNGRTDARVSLTTPDGHPLSTPAILHINVQAEIESIAAVVLGVGVAVLLVGGIIRTIRRRRRERVEASTGESQPVSTEFEAL